MARSREELADLECPACRRPFQAPLWLIVDAGERPDLREAILRGTLHDAACPHCAAVGAIKAPLLYHAAAEQQLIAALPLSVTRAEDARELVADLVGQLVARLSPEERQPYLRSVALATELDGLRAMLSPPEQDALEHQSAQAIEELLEAGDSESFRQVLVRRRALLMRQQADALLETLSAELRAAGEPERARQVVEQRALLSRFRTTLAQRRQSMAALLDQLAPLEQHELALLGPVRQMLEAVDQQEVYAARLELSPEQVAAADALLGRLLELAERQGQEESADYLRAVLKLREI